jgi:hypothetical protein
MATRAERWRYTMERSGPKRAKKVPDLPQPSLGRNATYALETPVSVAPPSRKSTRRSKHRQKAASSLKGRAQLEAASPARRRLTRT